MPLQREPRERALPPSAGGHRARIAICCPVVDPRQTAWSWTFLIYKLCILGSILNRLRHLVTGEWINSLQGSHRKPYTSGTLSFYLMHVRVLSAYVCLPHAANVCVPHACLRPSEARKGHRIPWHWNSVDTGNWTQEKLYNITGPQRGTNKTKDSLGKSGCVMPMGSAKTYTDTV